MKQENLNEIRNIYLDIATGGEGPEVLNEAENLTNFELNHPSAKIIGNELRSIKKSKFVTQGATNVKRIAGDVRDVAVPFLQGVSNPTSRDAQQRLNQRLTGQRVKEYPDEREARILKSQNLAIAAADKAAAEKAKAAAEKAKAAAEKAKAAAVTPTTAPVTQRPAAGTPTTAPVTQRPAAGTPTTAPVTQRPIPTNTSPIATSTADKIKGGLSNYQSQVKSGDVKGAEETGKSTFALANPKLAAAQAEKDRIRGTSQTDNPLMKDMKDRMPMTPSVQSPTLAKDLGVGTPSGSGNQSLLNNPNANKSPIINNKKPMTENNSYQWPSAKTIREIAGAYSSIYEAKKQVDQDEDGDNDFADNMIARMVASGMSREEAIKKVKNKNYNKKDELDEGIRSAIRGLFGRSKPKQSRGEELRSKYGSPARFGRPPRTPSGEKTKTRYDITLNSFGKEAADKVHRAAFNMLGIAPRDDGSHKPGTVTSGDYRGEGNSANTRMGNPPEDTRPMGIKSQLKQGHINSRGVKKPLARSITADFEMWVDGLLSEGYDLSEYTWDEMSEIYFDEATKMRKELGKEGEIETRKELARRSNAYQRSGSVDKTIAAAERGADRPYIPNIRGESDADRAARQKAKSKTLAGLAISRRSSVRDKPRAGLRGYAAKVEGSDRDLQSARSSAMAAGTLTPREKKQLNMEAYAAYEFVASYLLENNFASTVNDANVIINNMSEGWFNQIIQG